jgi:carbamoyl-phosphate synthase small subunit
MAEAVLVLSDGSVFKGQHFGAAGTTFGEVVFNTGMTGYQEALTDPSYAGQLLTMTYPLIGNYGVADVDIESNGVQVAGFVVRTLADVASNWRMQGTLHDYLVKSGTVGIQGIDTRQLTRVIRAGGVMMGAISSTETAGELLEKLQSSTSGYDQIDWVSRVTTKQPYTWGPSEADASFHVAVLDCGIKFNILRSLASRGVRTTVFPASTQASEMIATNPDGYFLSPGPGDPALLGYAITTVTELINAGKPVMGICLGNQLLGCALGGHTYKLPFGHRGANHPVKDLLTGKVVITSQNHGYALDPDSLPADEVEVTQINLNDGTVEGLRHRHLPVFSIQYHPEASPGPHDSNQYFDQFVSSMEAARG